MANYIISNSGSITIHVNGKSFTVDNQHKNYKEIVQCLTESNDVQLVNLLDVSIPVEQYSNGEIQIRNGKVYWKDFAVANVLTDRIIQFMDNQLPYAPLLAFFANLMQNPSSKAVLSLYLFLEHRGLPITPDGCFIAYKRVRPDWLDWWTASVDNSIGATPFMDRNMVDDTVELECSFGFHCGTMDYVRKYRSGEDGHYIRVKVNPRDVVSVPTDATAQKLRACTYLVLEECDHNEIESPLYGYIPEQTDFVDEEEEEEDYDAEEEDYYNEDFEEDSTLEGDEDEVEEEPTLPSQPSQPEVKQPMDTVKIKELGEQEMKNAITEQAVKHLSLQDLINAIFKKYTK